MPRIELQLFGYPSVRLDGHGLDLTLRKGLALLAYLAETVGPAGRDHMAGLLWPEADEEAARGRLRRTLHKIRVAFAIDVIDADRSTLQLGRSLSITVDTHAFEAACAAGEWNEALQLYNGDFLEGLSIDGCPEFEEWAFFRREALRSKLVHALERLVERELASGEPRAAVGAAARLVALDPLNEAAQRHLIGAYLHAGDRAAAMRQYQNCFRLLAAELGVAPDAQTQALLAAPPTAATFTVPRTCYAERSGLHIAYQVIGRGPSDLVLVPGFVSHVERIWEEPHARAALMSLSEVGRLIIFDRRGVGLSDRVGAAPTVDATAEDILTVIDAVGCVRVVLIGASEGGPGCIRFAASHPDRLAGLVLFGSMAKGSWAPDYPFALTHQQYDSWLGRLIANWGGPAEIDTFAPSLVGDRQAESSWAGLLRAASSPGAIKAVIESLRDTDVRDLLPQIRTPTLVMHRRDDRAVRLEAGRHLGVMIPGSRFVVLEGEDHWLWAGDQQTVLGQVHRFVRLLPQS